MPVGLRAEEVASAVLSGSPAWASWRGGGGKSWPAQPQGFKDEYSEWQFGQTIRNLLYGTHALPRLTLTRVGKQRRQRKFKILLAAIKKRNEL
jgi:hypothetical protein